MNNTPRFAVDVRTGKITNDIYIGSTGFISWRRLAEELNDIGPDEKIVVFEASEKGLTYIVTRKKDG